MKRKRSAIPALVFAIALTMPHANAQLTVNRGTIGGRVTDPSAAVIDDAEVTVRETSTNIVTTKKTDHDGRFLFPYLSIGAYQVTVVKYGFMTAVQPVTLTVGAIFDLPVTLRLGYGTKDDIAVTAELPPVIETTRSQLTTTLSQNEIADLPVSGRNYLDVALMAPGVSPTNTAANQLFAESSAVPGQGISMGSQRNFSNSFIIDGVSANDDAAGVAGAFVGLDVVEEFQVVTSGGQAELGRALGGYVNVVTRSGGNKRRGDLYSYLRNSRWNAANPLSHTVLPLTQTQYGGSLSGPLVRNRTFYFANFEGRDLNQSGLATIAPSAVTAINARLLAIGYPGPQISTGDFRNPVHNQNVFAKLDHHFSDADEFSARYTLYHVDSINSRGAGGLSAPTASANLFDTDHTIAASNTFSLSGHAVNETRAQFTSSTLNAPPSDPIGPAVAISGVATFGTLSSSPTARANKLYEITDSLAIQHGANSFRAGVDWLYNSDTITYPRTIRGSYAFSSLANFLAGTYNSSGYTQSFNVTQIHQTNPNVGFYAQDEYKLTSTFTLNLGLRYDLEFLRTIHTQTGNVSPRAGFAWAPTRSRHTVIRGGYGLFYDRVPLRPLANALLSANNTVAVANLQQLSISLSPTQAGAPVFPNTLASLTIPAGVFFNFSTMDPNIKTAYSEQGNFEIEQQLGRVATLSFGYEHVRGVHLIASVNQNVPSCAAVGTNDGCRPNLTYANDSQYSSAGDSHYDGAHISFLQRPAKWGNYRISYTYSKALDDVGEFFFSTPVNNFNIWQDYSRSDDDQRSRIAFEGTLHLTHGFELSTSLAAYSPLPFNITTGANTIQGTAARPTINGIFINRNAGEGHAILNMNTRLSRTFHLRENLQLQAIAEMFNVLNHVNVATINGVFGAGAYPATSATTFGQITAVNDPRAAEFALRLSF